MIPNGTRFIGIAPEVDLTERGSALLNKRTEPYTIDDIRGYKVFTALLTQSGESGGISISSGDLTIGVTYFIENNDGSGFDFTNVGAPNNEIGTFFVATGTTPNSWGIDGMLFYNTGAPVATILENTLGFNPYFIYGQAGRYISNNPEWPQEGNIQVFINCGNSPGNYSYSAKVNFSYEEYLLQINSFDGVVSADGILSDSDNFFRTSIEVRVYN